MTRRNFINYAGAIGITGALGPLATFDSEAFIWKWLIRALIRSKRKPRMRRYKKSPPSYTYRKPTPRISKESAMKKKGLLLKSKRN